MFSAARWRLTGVFTVVLAVILVTAGVAIYLTTSSVLFARVDDDLEERAVRDLSDFVGDRKSIRLNSSHVQPSRMPSSA